MHARLQTWPCALPRTVPEACPPIGNDKPLRMEGFFAACGLPDILERSPRGERPAARLRHRPCLMEDRGKPCGKSGTASAFPAGASPRRSITDRLSDKMAFRPSGQKSLRNGQAAGQLPCFLPRRPLPGTPTLPSLPVALNTALCTDSVPPCGVPCRQPNQSVCPTGSASSSQEGPFPYFPSYSSAPEASTREQERERESPSHI